MHFTQLTIFVPCYVNIDSITGYSGCYVYIFYVFDCFIHLHNYVYIRINGQMNDKVPETIFLSAITLIQYQY